MVTIEIAEDECDQCPTEAHVKAYVYAVLPSGRTIAYCGHHGTQHLDALHAQAVHVADFRYMLEP